MKYLVFLFAIVWVTSCQPKTDKEKIKAEIFQTEKAFEKMTSEKGVAEAFYFYADDSAVIHRETLIKGKENIRKYYDKPSLKKAVVTWTPDFIEVSDCGTLGYTYGKFNWEILTENGDTTRYNGIFHTVWKKQKDNTWKYVWD